MLWSKPAVVSIMKQERQDFLDELALQTGEGREQVQTLLENYALSRDRARETPPAPVRPIASQRRWSTVPKAPLADPRIDELSKRLEVVEEGMSRLIDAVTMIRKQMTGTKPLAEKEATARMLDTLAQLIENLRQANGL